MPMRQNKTSDNFAEFVNSFAVNIQTQFVTHNGNDDHTQYALLAGRTGGQEIIGGTSASNSITLESTTNVVKGTIDLKDPTKVDDIDTLTSTTLLLGKSTATKVEIAGTGIVTEVQGPLLTLNDLTVMGDLTVFGTTNVDDTVNNLTVTGLLNVVGNATIGGNLGGVDYIDMDITTGKPVHTEGRIFYDNAEHALVVYNDETDVTHQLGREGFIRVYNDTGSTIDNGKVVYINGTDVTRDVPTIQLARADSIITSKVIGITSHNIETASYGYVTAWGVVHDIDTSAFSEGDTLYLDNTIAGGMINIIPPFGSYGILIGFVIESSVSTGSIIINTNVELTKQVGDSQRLFVNVQKDTAGTLNKGDVVYITGYDNTDDVLTVELSDSSSVATLPALGIISETVTGTVTGKVIIAGRIDGLDTSAYSIGDNLYVSEIPGEFTNIKPTGTALIQKIAIVSSVNVSGSITVVGAGRTNDLPNIAQNNVWSGNVNGVPTETQDLVLNTVTADDLDASTATTLLLGRATATKIEIADTGIVTEIQGNLDVLEGVDVTGNITVTGTVDGIDIAGHDVATTGVHGVVGDIVGTTDVQSLTNKTITMAGDLTMVGNDIVMPDNTANALSIVEGANPYITFDTTNSAESINLTKNTTIERYNQSFKNETVSTNYNILPSDKNNISFTVTESNNIVTLPDATTLPNGWTISIQNSASSTTTIIVRNSSLVTIFHIGVDGLLNLILNDNSISAGVWYTNSPYDYQAISVAVTGGQFNSVKSAVDSITDNTATNRYIVNVGPGEFIEGAIIMKPYVEISGAGRDATRIIALSTSQTIITGIRNSSIGNLELTGASGSSGIGIYMSDAGIASTNPTFRVAFVKIDNCETCANVVGAINFANRTSLTFNNMLLNQPFINGVVITGDSGIAICSMIAVRLTCGNSTVAGVKVEGPGGVFALGVSNIIGANVGDGMLLRTGGLISASASKIQNMGNGINVENSGTGSKIELIGVSTDNNTTDLLIDQPTATGSVIGSFERSKTVINSTNIVVLTQDPSVVGTTLNGNLFVGKTIATGANVTELINNGTMGLINGGGLTDGGVLDINITAGFGYLLKIDYTGDTDNDHKIERIDWVASSLTLPSNSSNFIYVNTSGVLSFSPSRVSTLTNIMLGRVVTTLSSIEFIELSRIKAHHYGNFSHDYLREVLNVQYVSGSIVSTNASREIAITSGVFYYNGTRYTPSGGVSPITFYQYNRSAGSFIFSSATVVNNTQYDNGTNLTALTTSYYTKHLLYVVGDGIDERYMLVIGQEEFANITDARNGNIPNPPTYFNDGVARISSLIMQEGVTSVVEVRDERPRLSATVSAAAAVNDHGGLSGLIDDDHVQYLLVNGARSMTGNFNMGTNNITNVGTIDGIDILAHASRHGANSGTDALSTAAPITNIGSTTSNAVGSANTYARSDHQHGLDDTVVTTTDIQTLTNKTLTAPALNAVATLTLDDTNSAFNMALISTSSITTTDKNLTIDINDANRILDINGNIVTGSAFTTSGAFGLTLTQTALTDVTLPVTGTLATLAGSETLTNKTINADNNTITNLAHGAEVDDPSSGVHGVVGSIVGTTDAQTLTNKTIVAASNTVSGLLHGTHVDDPSSGVHGVVGSVVGTTDIQTLTNKTLTSPALGTSILDINGNELMLLTSTTDAVNEITLQNAATGNNPVLSMTGGDANIGMNFTTKGSGIFNFAAGSASNSSEIRLLDNTGDEYVGFKANAITTSYTLTTPAIQGGNKQVLQNNGSGVLTWANNGLYDDETFKVHDDNDATKIVEFELGGAATSTTTTVVVSQTIDRSITLPDATDTLIGKTTTDILTNKTMTSTTNNIVTNGLHSATTVVDVSASVAPTTGQILTATSATAATWQNIPPFGSNYVFANSETLSTTTSNVLQTKITLNTGAVPAGTYRIGWNYAWNLDDIKTNFNAEIDVDATVISNHVQEPSESAAIQRHVVAGFYHMALTAAPHIINIKYRSETAGNTAGINQARLEFWRVT